MVKSIHAFAEKVALIVGGGESVGRAVALQLALQGAYVIVGFSDDSEESRKITEQLKSLGTLAHALQFADAKQLIDEVGKIYGRIDLIVICVKPEQDSAFLIEEVIGEARKLTESRPKISIVVCGTSEEIIEPARKFARELPRKYRVNCVVSKPPAARKEFELFTENNFDDTARVVTFLLSSEAKALNGQTLFTD